MVPPSRDTLSPEALPDDLTFVRRLGPDLWHGLPALLWANLWFALLYVPVALLAGGLSGFLATALGAALAPVLGAPLFASATRVALGRASAFGDAPRALLTHLPDRLLLGLIAGVAASGALLSLRLAGESWSWVPALGVQLAVLAALSVVVPFVLCLRATDPRPLAQVARLAVAVVVARPAAAGSVVAALALCAVGSAEIGLAAWFFLPALAAFYCAKVALLGLGAVARKAGR